MGETCRRRDSGCEGVRRRVRRRMHPFAQRHRHRGCARDVRAVRELGAGAAVHRAAGRRSGPLSVRVSVASATRCTLSACAIRTDTSSRRRPRPTGQPQLVERARRARRRSRRRRVERRRALPAAASRTAFRQPVTGGVNAPTTPIRAAPHASREATEIRMIPALRGTMVSRIVPCRSERGESRSTPAPWTRTLTP